MAVKHARLGQQGVLGSTLCPGTRNLGWVDSDEERFRLMDRGPTAGMKHFHAGEANGMAP